MRIRAGLCFSALQRAENSSICRPPAHQQSTSRFQCSSASRKFLNRKQYDFADPALNVSVLFSEPKIPQFGIRHDNPTRAFLFQCSSASRKFLNCTATRTARGQQRVSVLFSEPKIPQSACWPTHRPTAVRCFSALQRAENSSIARQTTTHPHVACFSALQRAENSSMQREFRMTLPLPVFQCSSASRKFLNRAMGFPAWFDFGFQCSSASRKFLNVTLGIRRARQIERFSALQRAENSSMPVWRSSPGLTFGVSVLFSEPKIPQYEENDDDDE